MKDNDSKGRSAEARGDKIESPTSLTISAKHIMIIIHNKSQKSISFCLQRPTDGRLDKGGVVSNDCLASPHLSKHFSERIDQVK